ncbi:hypothetical protein AUC70_12755 [Methyloceanibacter stevinii]|uniref:Uncharacterized protein n=1 Tax=Methyloceanibacter stevinii TaxID=1774970 RepID=A0A1E3VUB1_9HYPH|nr:hypothetical protein AUC70_12755 [Methyloceanibacter stevinii]
MFGQGFVERVNLQRLALLVAIVLEDVLGFGRGSLEEPCEQFLEDRNLEGGDARVVDQVRLPKHGALGRQVGRHDIGEPRHLVRGDQERIEEIARRGAVGADAFRLGEKQCVERADADEIRPERRCIFSEPRQILEIADAPIARRAQRIGLHGKTPGTLFDQEGRPEGGVRQAGNVFHSRRLRQDAVAVQRYAHRLQNLGLGLVRRRDPVALFADIALGNAEAFRQFFDPIRHRDS